MPEHAPNDRAPCRHCGRPYEAHPFESLPPGCATGGTKYEAAPPKISLPEPPTWIADAIIGTLRQWVRDGPFTQTISLHVMDIDHLAEWARGLAEEHRKTREAMEARGFRAEEYPVRISGEEPFKGFDLNRAKPGVMS